MANNPFDDGLMDDAVSTPLVKNPFDDDLMLEANEVKNPFDDGLMDNQSIGSSTAPNVAPTGTNITLDALAENVAGDSSITPLSLADSAASLLGPGFANFVVGQGGAGLMSAADKVTRDVYTDAPIHPSEIIDRMRGGQHSQAMPGSVIADDSGASPIGAVTQALRNNPVEVDPAKQAKAEAFAEQTQNWKNDWIGEWGRQNLSSEELEAHSSAWKKAPAVRDFLQYGQPLSEGGQELSEALINPIMHTIDTLATKAALKLGNPDDPRDTEFYRSLLFFVGPGAAKGVAKGALKGAGKVADVAIATRRQKEFANRFRENPVDAVNEALPYTDLTPVEGKALLEHVRKTFPESREVVDPIDAAYRRSMPRDRQITEMVEAERSRKLPIEEFNDFFTHRAKLTAEERAGFIERGRQAKTTAELDAMFTEYSEAKLAGRKKSYGELDKLPDKPNMDTTAIREKYLAEPLRIVDSYINRQEKHGLTHRDKGSTLVHAWRPVLPKIESRLAESIAAKGFYALGDVHDIINSYAKTVGPADIFSFTIGEIIQKRLLATPDFYRSNKYIVQIADIVEKNIPDNLAAYDNIIFESALALTETNGYARLRLNDILNTKEIPNITKTAEAVKQIIKESDKNKAIPNINKGTPTKLSSMPMFDPARWREFARFVGWGKKTKGKQLLDQLLAKGIKQSDLKYLGWYDYLTAIADRTPEAKKMWELGKGRLDVVKKDLGTGYEGYSGYRGVGYKETGYNKQGGLLIERVKKILTDDDYFNFLLMDRKQPVVDVLNKFSAKYANDAAFKELIAEFKESKQSLDNTISVYYEPHYMLNNGDNLVFHTRTNTVPDNSNAYKYINDLTAKEAPFVKRHVASLLDGELPLDSTLELVIERLETIKEGASQGPKRKAQLENLIVKLNKYFPEDLNYYAIEEIQSVWKKDFEQGKTKIEPPLRQAYVDVALGDIIRQAKKDNMPIIWQHPKYFTESVGMALKDAEKLYGLKGAIAKYFKREYDITPEAVTVQGRDSFLVPIKDIVAKDSAWSVGYRKLLDWIQIDPNTLGTMMANVDLMKTIELGARRNQVTIEQYLTQSGMAAARAKQIASQVTSALKRSYDLGMIEPRIIMHNKDPWAAKAQAGIGIVLNDKERQYIRKDNGRLSKTKRVNPAPAVSEQLVREMRDSINPKFKKGGKENLRYYIKNPMQSVIDALGDFGKKRIYEPFLDATAAHNRHKLYIHEQLEQHIKGLKLKPAQLERVGNYAMSIQHNGVARLQAMHEIPLKWADLTTAERAAFDSLSPFYEHMYELANQGRIKSGEAPFQKVQNYTPLMMVHMIAEAAIDNIALWRKETGTLKQNFHKMKKPSWAFKRGVIRKGTYYELNIATQMRKHADSVLWHYYMSPIVAHTHELLSRHNVTGLPDWQQKINQKTSQPAKKTSWSIRNEAPDVYHAIAEYANSIHQRYVKRKIPNRDISNAMLRLKNNIAFSWLSGNMQTTLNQMGSMVNTLSLSDPVSLIRGIEEAALPRNWHSALRESRFLRERIGNTTELFNGVADLYGGGGHIRKAFGKFKDATMIPMQFVDAYNAMVAWHTGKAYGQLYHNLKGMDAIRFADEFTVKTQASNLAVHRPPIMRTDIGSVFTTLQTFHLNQFNVLIDDVFNVRSKTRSVGEKIVQPLLLGLGVAAMNTVYQDGLNTYSPFWSPIQSFCDTLEESNHTADAIVSGVIELFQAVPFISSGKYGKGMGGPAYTTVSEALGMSGLNFKKNVIARWNAKADEGYSKWDNFRFTLLTHPTIVSAARMTGLPLVQQLSKWAKIAERAEMNGEDIPPFNKILGSTYERAE